MAVVLIVHWMSFFAVYQLITRRRFEQMAVLEGQNILVTISGRKRRIRVYYLSWLKQKILRTEGVSGVELEKRNGWVNVGDLQGAVHFKIVRYERIKFLVVGLEGTIEIYAWAPKPYHKFMAFKVLFIFYFLHGNNSALGILLLFVHDTVRMSKTYIYIYVCMFVCVFVSVCVCVCVCVTMY
ncbi:unnamed protein product [Gongylonema pulchrum]|uniref:non-specific serine/threonine protein kinase n=1 Tax=Gongylonema pulchrum TaxID=637853 RepID=A0A183E1Y9_9BILA|nr:unnamed protein product [Gongylonema pulchrum]